MTALSGGHLAVDFAGGALFVLIPYLHDKFDLSYTLAAVLVLCSTVSGSLLQPLFGLWSDRRGAIWLIPVGVAAGGIGIALAAIAPSYALIIVFVIVGGNVGFGLGALAAAVLVHSLGLHGGLLLAVPCVVAAVVLFSLRGYLLGFVPDRETA